MATVGRVDEMKADDLLCSRNARPQKAVVGRAQWKINRPSSLKRERASLEGSHRDERWSIDAFNGKPLKQFSLQKEAPRLHCFRGTVACEE